MLSDKVVERIKRDYPKGTRIELHHMVDNYGVPDGTLGTVDFVDDAGQIHMKWDNGRTLALIEHQDAFSVIEEDLDIKI